MKSFKLILMVTVLIISFPKSGICGEPPTMEMDEEIEQLKQKIDETTAQTDSLNQAIEEMSQAERKAQMEEFIEQNKRNLDSFMAEQQAREKKNNTRLFIRLGLLVITIIALIVSRVNKKKAQANE
ncbi:MAG: hypothetical protein H6607_03930 [Flavobacteriales bacterium]|nr:hypothetical protein [Flavobacteriales bacterium]